MVKKNLLPKYTLLVLLSIVLITSAFSITVDDFEDGDATEYNISTNDAGTDYDVVKDSSNAQEGSYYLKVYGDSDNDRLQVLSTDGLDVYPDAGDKLTYHVNKQTGCTVAGVFFGVQNEDNLSQGNYHFRWYDGSGGDYKANVDNGTGVETFFNVDSSYGSGWQKYIINWGESGEIKFKVVDDGSLVFEKNATDTTWSQGGIGYHAYSYCSGGPEVWYDNITLISGNDKPKIDLKSPNNINQDPNNGVTLTANISDPDNDKMNITFYNASNDKAIGKVENVTGGDHSVTWTGLNPDQTYNWHAEVTDGRDNAISNTHSFTTIDIDLSWTDNSDNEGGFNLYSNATGTYSKTNQVAENTVSYKAFNKGLEFGEYTCYKVTAFNQYGESDPVEGCLTP